MNLNDLTSNFQFSHRMVMGLCIALTALVCITFTYSAWQWRNDWVLSRQNNAAAPELPKIEENNDLIASIPGDHIFGKSTTNLGQMPVTNLQMSVTGIVKVTEQSGLVSKAYISISGQPSKIYQVGDNLPYGVKVYDITPSEVILENDGHFEKLPLPREKLKFKPGKPRNN
jgi:general secretion pathway protein C